VYDVIRATQIVAYIFANAETGWVRFGQFLVEFQLIITLYIKPENDSVACESTRLVGCYLVTLSISTQLTHQLFNFSPRASYSPAPDPCPV